MVDLREIEVNPADTVKWTKFLARKDILWGRMLPEDQVAGAQDHERVRGVLRAVRPPGW
jgi:hypothetical protein